MELKRRINPLTLLMISINGMVGSAWLFAPLYAAKIAGPGSIIAWIIGGAATILIALTFAELSVLLPVPGGSAAIPELSHGRLTSFILSWIAWLSALTMAPIEVQAVIQYSSTYFSSLTHVVEGIPLLTMKGFIAAFFLMLLLCLVNIFSIKGLLQFNFILFIFKVSVIILTIFLLLKTSFHFGNFYQGTSVGDSHGKTILTALATGGIAFAFTGFKHGVELAGEAKNQVVAIPLAIVGSIVCCLLLYLGLQIAFIAALSPQILLKGWGHIQFLGDVGPFAGLALGLGLFWLLKLLYIDAVISPLGAGLIYVTSTARVLYAMSSFGYFSKIFTYLNRQKLPVAAIFLNFILGLFLFLPLPGWQAMVSFLVSGMVISYAMGPISLLCLRLELPQEKRLFKLPLAPLLCLIAFYFCNLISYWTGWQTISKWSIAILIGFFFFFLAWLQGKLNNKPLGIKSAIWLVPYLFGLIIISYLGAFGGKNIIPFGWDFLVIGIFSIFILWLAVFSRSLVMTEQLLIAEDLG